MNIAARLTEALQPDRTIAITRAVAEEIGCPEWMARLNECGTPEECFCKNAAEAVLRAAAKFNR